MEKWIDVVGFECNYKVSNYGRVMKVATGLILKTGRGGHGGYHRAELWGPLGMERRYVHRLVLEAFVGPCGDGMECRHLDGNPANNRLENLAWGTPAENTADKIRHGTYVPKPAKKPCTHKGPRRKLTTEQFAALQRDRANGMTQKAVAEKYGMSEIWVSSVECGRIKHKGEPLEVPQGYRQAPPYRNYRRGAGKAT